MLHMTIDIFENYLVDKTKNNVHYIIYAYDGYKDFIFFLPQRLKKLIGISRQLFRSHCQMLVRHQCRS